jgi:serine protease Do
LWLCAEKRLQSGLNGAILWRNGVGKRWAREQTTSGPRKDKNMNRTWRAWALLGSGFVTGISAYLVFNLVAVGNEAVTTPPNLTMDPSPLADVVKQATSYAPVIRQASPSVVNIYTERRVTPEMNPLMRDPMFRRFFGLPEEEQQPGGRGPSRVEQSLGSGVIVSENGFILTNNHVVEGADDVRVVLPDGRTDFDARVIGRDPQTDVAVLKIEATGLPAITITDSDNIEVGDVVLAIGNPFGIGQTVTKGIISATGRGGFGIVRYEDFIQTDASINRGNSGGALLDAQGRLIGINTFIMSGTGGNVGLGFAIPINMARNVMDLLIREGRVTRGYMGVELEPELTADLAKALKLPDRRGALVTSVMENTPAARAGLEPGDVIVEFNQRRVDDRRHLQLMVSQIPPGTETPVKVIRDGREEMLRIVLAEFPSEIAGGSPQEPPREEGRALWGIEVRDLTPELRRQFNVPQGVQGAAVVVEIDQESAAFRSGLRVGHVILEVNRQPITSAADVLRYGREAQGEAVLFRVWSGAGSRYLVITPNVEQR